MRIAIVAGEISGDMLGAGLIKELRQRYPQAKFEGVGGPQMQAQGFDSLAPMEHLAVMGLFEILGQLREILRIRRTLIERWLANPPDVFIGIDAPDFNLGLAEKLHQGGIKTAHYVSPSVWMWRQKRVVKIARSVDLMLTLFPFEAQFYREHQVPVVCVGHHLADKIPLAPDTQAARAALELPQDKPLVCLMPGSRKAEVAKLGQLFLQAAKQMLVTKPDLQFIIPTANPERHQELTTLLASLVVPLPVTLVAGNSHQCMEACDAILLASGTATLEAMLYKKPMVVSYVINPVTFYIVKRMVSRQWVSLPNLLANQELVPELLQADATAEKLAATLLELLDNQPKREYLQHEFFTIHQSLKLNADVKAAQAISQLLEGGHA